MKKILKIYSGNGQIDTDFNHGQQDCPTLVFNLESRNEKSMVAERKCQYCGKLFRQIGNGYWTPDCHCAKHSFPNFEVYKLKGEIWRLQRLINDAQRTIRGLEARLRKYEKED